MIAGDIALAIALAAMVACSLYIGPRIRADRIAMQWGFDGKPTWSAPKPIGLWALPVFAICIRVLIFFVERYRPDLVHDVPLGVTIMAVVVAACHVLILRSAARNSVAP